MAIRFSLESNGVTRTYDLKRSVVTFGRSQSCTVHVDDPALSRTHCQLETEGHGCFARDLNSRNGTELNGERIDRSELGDGDQLVIGNSTITFLGQDQLSGIAKDDAHTQNWTSRLFTQTQGVAGDTPKRESGGEDSSEIRRLRRLIELNKRIASELEPERVLTAILDSAVEFVEAERGFLVTVEEESLYIPVARDFWRKDIPAPAFEVSRSVALEVVRRGTSLMTEDATEDERFDEMVSVYDLKIRSVLCVPLKDQGKTIGAIYLDNRFTRGSFGVDDMTAIEAFADQAAISLVNSGVFDKTREISQRWKAAAKQHHRELRDVRAKLAQFERADGLLHDYRSIIGRSGPMRECLVLIDRVTPTDLAVMICGESGTGKELLARALHANGPRAGKAFVAVNCAAFSGGLIESELFGHARGAFTGSVGERKGLFESAHEGTLFLDEIGDLEPDQQKSLLRVLETGELRRLGESTTRKVDVRVISATHQDLEALMDDGRFRADLYFRLKGVMIQVPPLRDRVEDIPPLTQHFLANADGSVELAPKAMKALVAYRWPGNVRELKNEIDRLAALGSRRATVADLSFAVQGDAAARLENPVPMKERVVRLERELIERALLESGGNKTRAAEALGLSRLGLRKKMARYEIE